MGDKIVYGLVAVDLSPYVMHPMRLIKSSHSMSFGQIHTPVDYCKYSFYPIAIVQWNRLLPSIALLPTFDSFKRAVCSQPFICLKCQRVVFNLLACAVILFLTSNILTLSSLFHLYYVLWEHILYQHCTDTHLHVIPAWG